MPMITEASHRVLRFAGTAAAVLVIWFVGMAAAALVVTPTVVVAFGDPGRLAGADGDLLTSGRGFLAMRTGSTETVKTLYQNGAWLVWPVLTAICQDASQFGFEAALWLTRKIANPQEGPLRKQLTTFFEVHGTTGQPPKRPIRILPDGLRIPAE